ncbi:MAG: glycine betaine ABC transporter substrate-binding protein [Limosilactobacillus sp.]|uniref:glycine betaine ABC transporter substrate-binding protein n=1 Tax=Limosilactobacillus sp. TaxID=2773925 RepID=UPI0027023898|nr:glycine betaine ABC transporter substrate-binding protein [Limosilactobacillus sp.]
MVIVIFKKMIYVIILVTTLICFGIVFAHHSNSNDKTIVIGSKSFSESRTVSEIYALALEHQGYKVIRKTNIANSVVYNVLKTGQIDLYPEYTGTIVETYLKKSGSGLDSKQMARLASNGVKKEGLATLQYAPGINSQAIAVRSEIAKKYHLNNLSDLQKNATHIRFVSQGEFDKRQDGLSGLNKKYGKFNFKSDEIFDDSLKYLILSENKGDAAPVYSTDGQLATGKYKVLDDEKKLWPPYNLVPLVNAKALRSHPKIATALNQVDKKLTTKELMKLNKQVDVEKKNYRMVAYNWYKTNME